MFTYYSIKELLEKVEEVNKIRDILDVKIENDYVVIILGPFRGSQNIMTLKFIMP